MSSTALAVRAEADAPGGFGIMRVGGDHQNLVAALGQGSRERRAQRSDALRLRIEVVGPQLEPHGQYLP